MVAADLHVHKTLCGKECSSFTKEEEEGTHLEPQLDVQGSSQPQVPSLFCNHVFTCKQGLLDERSAGRSNEEPHKITCSRTQNPISTSFVLLPLPPEVERANFRGALPIRTPSFRQSPGAPATPPRIHSQNTASA